MSDYLKNSHWITNLSCHVVWATKYRYDVLQGDIQHRCRDLLIQICNSENVHVLKGVVSKDHIHMHIEYPPSLSISVLVKKLKVRSSRILQQEFPKLNKQYWGRHFWALGYGAWSTGKITDEMVQEYLEHHEDKPNSEKGNWILE
ncbi:IS200/IS605 family transposase [Sabulilitoribacter arenilitoris]|uniref:IS200/IS605 family transposase n=1 Tax=Wocania arenilitoris TaxID=2044858 RepID=A0AAE3JNV3_9FLAO|nr:IS200/IS605 family transposase [Wocania arenilitoris]